MPNPSDLLERGGRLGPPPVFPGRPVLGKGMGMPQPHMLPPRGYISISERGGALRWIWLQTIGEAEPLETGLGDGYDTDERPGHTAVTVWRGGQPLAFEVPVTIDGYQHGNPVSAAWKRLVAFSHGDEDTKPPLLNVSGPVPYKGHGPWWLAIAPTQGTALRNRSGELLRQEMTLRFTQYTGRDLVAKAAPNSKAAKKTAGEKPRFAEIKKGETLKEFAKRVLKDGRRWRDIRDANGLNWAAGHKAPKPTRLRLP